MYAEPLARAACVCLLLRPQVKLGQMGATRSDFVHKEYVERCETLQDDCPHQPLSYVEALLERSLGRPVRDVFARIDPEPLGAASIGQVHRAVLLDGREVAVKVQYPRVEALFRGVTEASELREPLAKASPAEELPVDARAGAAVPCT